MKKSEYQKITLAATVCAIISTQVHAGSELETLINMLHANGTVSDAQYGRLIDEMRAEQVISGYREKESAGSAR